MCVREELRENFHTLLREAYFFTINIIIIIIIVIFVIVRAKQGVKGFIILSYGMFMRRTMSGLSEDPKQGAISEALVKNLSFYRFCNHSCLATKSRWHPN